jgi:hypothetical protein
VIPRLLTIPATVPTPGITEPVRAIDARSTVYGPGSAAAGQVGA